MIQKWKTILINWMNCFSSENEKRQQNVTPENLLNLFTHIHENLTQDDFKCSKIEAHTIQDFIVEKYPEFKFENGTHEPVSEEEIFIVASLLLFFVCVNSKYEDIKRVMCSKLNGRDQEIILKFSKCLMECSPVLYADVEAAITEACGDVSANVAETPPALRSLHGEVRRLQAALDAERFDRNYLQDELARTNLKLDKLKKDKEQYKLDIVNLKAKISLCCGEQHEDRSEARADDSRLQRQLQELEERLVDTQGRLDDVQHERDTYKKKADDLKQERDKWLALCQQEADKAGQLMDQLDTERRTVQALKDLVSELRQHNRNNGLDTSMLECDDPDTSVQSLSNLSVCSEACANVVEVQLGEERAKIEVLKQQIQGLKDQFSEANQRYESEKLSFETIISEKDNDLFNLKCRINEEIEEKNNLKTHYEHEVAQLSTKIVELTQHINDNEEKAKHALDEKIRVLQSLQLQMAEETKKSGNIIKNLQIELEAEKYAELKLKDDCDSRIMKLNEKVLNRNNELVELQNNIIMKSEMIELIQSDLRKEKELRDELSNSCNNQLLKLNKQRIAIENDLQQKAHEIAESQKQLHERELCIDRLSKEVDQFRTTVSSLEEKCHNRECKIIDKQKEIEFLNDVFQEDQEKLLHKVDERNATIKSLQMQLQNEIEYKVELQKELAQLQTTKISLIEEVTAIKSTLLEKEKMIDAMDICLKEEKTLNEDLKLEFDKKNQDFAKHAEEIANMKGEINSLQDHLECEKKLLEGEIKNKNDIIESTKSKLSLSLKEKADLQESFNSLTDEKARLIAAANEKQREFLKLKTAYEKLCREHYENKQNVKSLEAKLNDEVKKNEQLQDSSEKNTSKLLLKLEKTEKSIKKIHAQSKSILDSKELQIQTLTLEIPSLQQTIESERQRLTIVQKEKDVLEQNLSEEMYFRNRLEEEYQKKCNLLEDVTSKLHDEIRLKSKDIENMSQVILKLEDKIRGLETEVDSEKTEKLKVIEEYEKHVHELCQKELKNNKELADKNAKIERMISDFEKEKESTDKVSKLLQEEIILKSNDIANLSQVAIQLENKIKGLETEVDSEKTAKLKIIEEYEKHVHELGEKELENNKELADKNTKIEHMLSDLKQEKEFEDKLSKLQEEIILKSKYIDNLSQVILKLENKVRELETEVDSEKTAKLKIVEEYEKHVHELSEKELENNKELADKNAKIEHMLSDLKQEKELEDKFLKLQEEIIIKSKDIENLSQVILKLKNKIKGLETEVDFEKTAKVKIVEEYEKHVHELSEKELKNNKELADKNAKIERMLSDLEQEKESKDKVSKLQEEIILKSKDIANLSQVAIQLENKIKVLETEIDSEKSAKLKIIEEYEKHVHEVCEKELKNNKELADKNAKIEDMLSDLKQEKQFEDKLSKLQEESILKSKDIDNLSQVILKLENTIKGLETEVVSEKTANLKITEQYVKLLQEVGEKELKNNKELADKNAKIECMLSNLKEEKELKDKFSKLQQEVILKSNDIANLSQVAIQLENKIKGLETEVDSEKTAKLKIIEEYEKHVSELSEKELKHNKELVDKNAKIERMLSDLQQENELKDKFSNMYHKDLTMISDEKIKIENELHQQILENEALQKEIKVNVVLVEELKKEVAEMKSFAANLEQECCNLKETNDNLLKEVVTRGIRIEENQVILEDTIKKVSNEKDLLMKALDEKNNTVKSLQTQMQSEIKLRTRFEEQNAEHESNNSKFKETILMLQKDNEELQFIIEEKNSNHEILLIEKEKSIEVLDEKLKYVTNQLECLKKDYTDKTLMWEKLKFDADATIQVSLQKIAKLEGDKAILMKEIEALKEGQKEILAVATQERTVASKQFSWERDAQGLQNQVDTTTSDFTHSSMESLKTISDLEKIVQDKNRKITTMHTEITHIKSMMAESGLKLIDVTNELQVSKDTCEELSTQLKKIVQQKNEDIADLKRQVMKMSATENRASEIIKVSAKYQAMILKRIAEIKSTAVLKELTNIGNSNSNCDNELRRSLTAGCVTMEDLENFLETTDRHLKRCSEKQISLQKDRDRLSEVNRIYESEIVNMKKFLTEMSVSFRTFTTVKDVYGQKLSKIVSLQRMVRRDLLTLDGRITEAAMCKLERGYAAVMQDLAECAMTIERWVDRSVSRMLSPEKIQQAFTSDLEQTSLCTANYQNAAVEVQLSELENSFQKLLGEVARALKGEGARSAQELTIMEVRAEYEDKLNRMKAKMKELFHEEMGRLKQKQSEEIAVLERELIKSREKLAESSRAYEDHIRALTTELWSVGEKFLVKQEEAEWLRKKESGSLMSLQHVHSAGLQPSQQVTGRQSDTFSLRSLPMHSKKTESRGLHMSDEEGEVFDNRFLKELSVTPRASLAPGQRISELKRRNSLVPPHLKSSYPAEMQFAPTLDEEDIKCVSATSFSMGRQQRKEVGITAYKKPGPPTPSKQAGRLSATDAELRESLRVEAEPHAGRKTSTPSRIRSLFRSHRTDVDEGTPRNRRFSNIFRKK